MGLAWKPAGILVASTNTVSSMVPEFRTGTVLTNGSSHAPRMPKSKVESPDRTGSRNRPVSSTSTLEPSGSVVRRRSPLAGDGVAGSYRTTIGYETEGSRVVGVVGEITVNDVPVWMSTGVRSVTAVVAEETT